MRSGSRAVSGMVLIDTNVLVYAHDRGEPSKQLQAIRVLRPLRRVRRGRLSAQVLGEFFRATTKGQQPMLAPSEARQQLARLARSWPTLPVTADIVLEAARGVVEHQFALLRHVPRRVGADDAFYPGGADGSVTS